MASVYKDSTNDSVAAAIGAPYTLIAEPRKGTVTPPLSAVAGLPGRSPLACARKLQVVQAIVSPLPWPCLAFSQHGVFSHRVCACPPSGDGNKVPMSFINYAKREIQCKLVYYGPGRAGKTTNVEHIHQHTLPQACGRLIKLDTETERTLFFDFMPLSLGKVRGFDVRFHLYTVPGQVFYEATRKLVLRGVDGLVFVADSQQCRMDANLESMANLHTNLAEQGQELTRLAFAIQYNKRDAPGVVPLDELRAALNPTRALDFEAVAAQGVGVFETLKAISKLMLSRQLAHSRGAQLAEGGAR